MRKGDSSVAQAYPLDRVLLQNDKEGEGWILQLPKPNRWMGRSFRMTRLGLTLREQEVFVLVELRGMGRGDSSVAKAYPLDRVLLQNDKVEVGVFD